MPRNSPLFPHATAPLTLDVTGSGFSAVIGAFWRRLSTARRVALVVWTLVMLVAGVISAGLLLGPIGMIGAVVAGIAPWGIAYTTGSERARDAFWQRWAQARGLGFATTATLSWGVPILSLGHSPKVASIVSGNIAGLPGSVVEYSYVTGSGKSQQTHHITLVAWLLPDSVAARYPGVYVRRRSLSAELKDLWDTQREVTFESAEFDERFHVSVESNQDDVAVLELFSTTFIQSLVHSPYPVAWEQRGSWLVQWDPTLVSNSQQADEMCSRFRTVLDRYAEEHQ